ncbi:MAG: helix-turn-helix transcriptional regulator [Lachnospiraceae bacterium]|nr:helix-turn-helix transcriptional regulator [Lachnospiraceae bacterium]
MDNITGNPVLNPDNYIQTRTPDVSELANLIRKAKGVNRTMSEFAEMCGVSASTFSRIANGKITQPLSLEILTKICLNADPDAGIYIGNLAGANGMVTKEFLSYKDSHGVNAQKDEQRFSTENEMKNIVSAALLERGLVIAYQKRIHISEGVPAIASGCGRGNLLVRIQGYEPMYWKYKMMSYTDIKRCVAGVSQVEGIDYECEADVMFHHEAEYFLLDAWESERFRKVKMSYVFPDREIYEAFYKRVENARVNNWISLVLVDLKSGCVIEERFLNRVDGKSCSSVFELPLMEEDEECFDLIPKTTDIFEE